MKKRSQIELMKELKYSNDGLKASLHRIQTARDADNHHYEIIAKLRDQEIGMLKEHLKFAQTIALNLSRTEAQRFEACSYEVDNAGNIVKK